MYAREPANIGVRPEVARKACDDWCENRFARGRGLVAGDGLAGRGELGPAAKFFFGRRRGLRDRFGFLRSELLFIFLRGRLFLCEKEDLDASSGTPGGLAFEAEGSERFAEGLAETELIEDVESYSLGMLGVDGVGERLNRAPCDDGRLHGGGGHLRAGAG